MSDDEGVPRCGDAMLHKPSGEVWVVAFVDNGMLAWSGWPAGMANLDDFEMAKRASDEEHLAAVKMWNDEPPSAGDWRRDRVLRLYGDVLRRIN